MFIYQKFVYKCFIFLPSRRSLFSNISFLFFAGSIYIRQGPDNNILLVDLSQNDTTTLIDNRTVVS